MIAMKKSILFFIFLVAASTASIYAQQLVKVWETAPVLKTPESVIYCPGNDQIYVANINGNASEKDGNGFISILSSKGEVVNLEWVSGLHAPKGMGIYEGILYVADIDQLVEIDMKAGKIVKKYDAPGAEFLNDVTVCPDGKVLVTDMMKKKIHMLKDGQFTEWFHSETFNRPNGLFAEKGKLYVGDQHIFVIDMPNKTMEVLIADAGGVDGLEKDNDGNFVFSHWAGRIFINKDGKTTKLFDSSEQSINSADIDFASKLNLVLVPTFMDNRVVAYKLP